MTKYLEQFDRNRRELKTNHHDGFSQIKNNYFCTLTTVSTSYSENSKFAVTIIIVFRVTNHLF